MKCDIVCFQETKLSSLNSFVVRSLWGSPFLDCSRCSQYCRGVLLVWDKRVFEKVDCVVGLYSVNVLLKGVADDFVWACLGVYGPNKDNQRGALWEELSRMHFRWNTTWCVFGDFNTIRYSSERFGCEAFSPVMFAFSNFIKANYLVDLTP